MSNKILLFVLCIMLVSLSPSRSQQLLRGKRKPGPRPNFDKVLRNKENKMLQALTINYPLKFFDATATADWRTKAHYDVDLVQASEGGRLWSEHSFAQDQEDVWLYENWFYGMKGGVIMESGALNGVLFSNSYMFEHFANWTAIHVGQCSVFHSFVCANIDVILNYIINMSFQRPIQRTTLA